MHSDTFVKWRNTFGYYGLFVCLGLGLGIAGPTLPDLARQTGSSVGGMGLLFLFGSIGYTAGTFLGGPLFDRVRGHVLLGFAELTAAGCLALVPTVRSLWLLLALAALRGLVEGMVNTGPNILLLWTHREKAGPFINGLHFCFGLGAFVAPLAVARLTPLPDGYRFAYWGVAGFAALASLSVLFMPGSPDPREHTARAARAQGGSTRIPLLPIGLAALYLFAYVGGEISFGNWIYTYAVTLQVASETGAAYLNSAFWLSFTVGRLVSIPVAIGFRPRQVIPAALVSCLTVCGLLIVLPPSNGLLWAAAIGLGFSMAPLWPTGYTLAGQIIPMTAFASGLVLLGDSFGVMVLPSFAGKVMELAGPRFLSRSLPLLVFGSLAVCLVAFFSLVRVGRAGRSP